MQAEALVKIQAEIDANKANPYVMIVGKFMIEHVTKHPESAEKIMAEDKSIAKSLDAMRSAAEKKKVGNCAVLTDGEGFDIVLQYYGIDGKTRSSGLDLNLDDLLGG